MEFSGKVCKYFSYVGWVLRIEEARDFCIEEYKYVVSHIKIFEAAF